MGDWLNRKSATLATSRHRDRNSDSPLFFFTHNNVHKNTEEHNEDVKKKLVSIYHYDQLRNSRLTMSIAMPNTRSGSGKKNVSTVMEKVRMPDVTTELINQALRVVSEDNIKFKDKISVFEFLCQFQWLKKVRKPPLVVPHRQTDDLVRGKAPATFR